MRFFSSQLEPGERRVYAAVTVYYLFVAAALIWPVYPLFARPRPLILGLPLSLFYPAAILVISFSVLLGLFAWEGRREGRRDSRPPKDTAG